MKHTPGPLSLVFGKHEASIHNDSGTVANIPDDLLSWKENAEFILKACLSHYDLLEACKFAFKNLKPQGNVKKDFSGHNAMATLSRAIQKAE